MRSRFLLLTAWLSLPCLPGTTAAESRAPGASARISFNDDIRPILNRNCIGCHGGVKEAGNLSFLYRDDVLSPAKSGNIPIVPGRPDESHVIHRISDPEDPMPPPEHAPPLPERERELLRRWIAEGAPWEEHWAFITPVRPEVPEVGDPEWSQNPVDRFIRTRLDDAGLAPNPPQDRARWIRRVSFDLTGLPPAPEEVDAFVNDPGPDAYARVVDRLLASPHFGERWASMWLDAVRYADSKGLGLDANRVIWKFRDWVIDAFNSDMPYDEFTVRQLAGDLLPDATLADRIATACHRNTATNDEGGTDDEEFRIEALMDRVNTTWQTWQGVTFGCVQCHAHPYDPFRHSEYYSFMAVFNQTRDTDTDQDYPVIRVPVDPAEYPKADALDREIHSLKRALHDPAFRLAGEDGIWQPLRSLTASATGCGVEVVEESGREHYHLTGTIAGGNRVTVEAPAPAGVASLTALRLDALPEDAEKARTVSEWGFVVSSLEVTILPIEGDPVEVAFRRAWTDEFDPFLDPEGSIAGKDANGKPRNRAGGFSAFTRLYGPRWGVFAPENPVSIPPGATIRVSLSFNSLSGGSHPLVIRRGAVSLSTDPRWTALVTDPALQEARKRLADLRRERNAMPTAPLAVMEEREPHLQRSMQLFIRGNWLTRGDDVPPGTPASFPPLPEGEPVNRLTVARWLVAPENPLTARVMVNRLWEQLFGTGIVETMEDFGSAGEKPSHPALLDWLAVHFREDLRWSVKSLLRELVLSATYRQDNRITPEKLERDPQNRLLSRGPRLRLTAEMIRDQALAVSGLLHRELHGPPVYPPLPDGVWQPFVGSEKWPVAPVGDPKRYRRAVYTHVKRSIPYPTADTFDSPSREVCSQRRITSNTPLQALTTLNDEAFREAAGALAGRMTDAADDPDARIAAGYRATTGRQPDARTLARLRAHLDEALALAGSESLAWESVATVLLNLDEVLTR